MKVNFKINLIFYFIKEFEKYIVLKFFRKAEDKISIKVEINM